MPTKLSKGKILILAGGIERRKLRQLSTLQISSKSGYTDFVNYEYEQLKEKVEHLINLGINVLAVKDNIDDNVHKMLAENGIQCFRRVPKEDLELISESCNANMVLSVENAGVEDLGDFISSTCNLVGGVNQWTLEEVVRLLLSLSKAQQKQVLQNMKDVLMMHWALLQP